MILQSRFSNFNFFEVFCEKRWFLGGNVWSNQKKVVPLHAFSRRVYAGVLCEDNINNNSARQHREQQGGGRLSECKTKEN